VLKALVTDIDGTITDRRRRISTPAIEALRVLIDAGIEVVLASGNTVCFMDGLCRMIGTNGTIISENGGVYRRGFGGTLHIPGNRGICLETFDVIREHFAREGIELELLSARYRFADVAFARKVDPDEVKAVAHAHNLPAQVLDTGFAIHIQDPAVSKGTALRGLMDEMELLPSEILAIGDSENDIEMLEVAGVGVAVANAPEPIRSAADRVTREGYGDGFVEAVRMYYPDLFSR